MIRDKRELNFYIQADLMMNRGSFKKNLLTKIKEFILPDYIMNYLRYMRKADYYSGRGGEYE